MSSDPPSAAASFLGGRICLDFANTVDWRTSSAPQELMADYDALLDWSLARRTMAASAAAALRGLAMTQPDAVSTAFGAARAIRAEIWKAGDALHRGEAVDLDRMNRFLMAVPAQPRLISDGSGHVHDLPGRVLEEPLWPILWSFTALMASENSGRVRCCDARDCGWLFVDVSPNRSRLWCSSEGCGNRERARRAYAKRRSP